MLVSFIAWFASNLNLAGGSSKLLVTPIIDFFLGSEAVIPIITTETLLSNSQKIYLLWQAINWQVLKWYFPGAGIGALLSAYVFARANQLQRLPILLGLYLTTAAFSPYLSRTSKHFPVRCWYFLLAGFACAFISKFLGSTGSLLNDLYPSYGLSKEQTIATKAANVLGINISKMCIYALCGVVTENYIIYGVAIAVVIIPANLLARLTLQKIEGKPNYLINSSTAVTGALILWQQQNYCYSLVNYLFSQIYLLTDFLITSPVCHL